MRQRLPTELIGSYALPSWLHIAIERIERQADLGGADVRETLDDAVTIAVSDQERAGLDVGADGEMRRRDFIQNFYGRLTGALQFAGAEQLVITPDCGFNHCPRHIAFRKMRAMVAGAMVVREELQ